MPAEISGATDETQLERTRGLMLLFLVLVITTAGSLALSHVRMMWSDELLSYWGDRMPTAAEVLHVQLNYPISLDPPTYHLLSHWSMQLFGQGAMGMRMPALLGVVLSQVTLFFFVRRIAGSRSAVLAAAFPAALGPFWYSAEGRPYGWMLGMYGVAMLCWQKSIGDESGQNGVGPSSKRRLALAGLVLAIAGAITSHYFGVLILLPLAVGELTRIIERRRIDWPVVFSLVLGAGSVVLILPFQKALKVYQLHYYNRHVTLEAIKLGYTNVVSQSIAATCLLVVVVGVVGYIRCRKRERHEPAAVWAMLLTLALMPVSCFLFERFVTHSMEGRYAIPAVLAFVAVLAMALEPLLRKQATFYVALALVVLAGLGSIAVKIRRERRFRNDFMSELKLPETSNTGGSARPIYVNSFGDFLQDQYYAPPELQSRLAYVYDAEEEILWKGRDTHSVSAVNVRNYSPLHLVPYGQLLQEKEPLVLIYGVRDWEWLPEDLADKQMTIRPLGKLMLGQLGRVETAR